MNNQKNWIKIRIDDEPALLESISPLLFDLGCTGIEEVTGGFMLYFEEEQWDFGKQEKLISIIQSANTGFDPKQIMIDQIPEENWMEEWKKGFESYHVSDNLVIKPDWEYADPQKGETLITIAPKMAFGTGHHESTRLILRLLPDYIHSGFSVLDLGTGSGILAIYAAKLGASKVLGVDNDPIALDNFNENVQLNNCSDKIQSLLGTIDDLEKTKYNLILANINRNALMGIAAVLSTRIFKEGFLILSGILKSDESVINKVYSTEGWDCIKREQENEWISMVFQQQ